MQHDLIEYYLDEIISKVEAKINNHQQSINALVDEVAPYRELKRNGHTKSYVIVKSQSERLDTEQSKWCVNNLGYNPICMFVEPRSTDSHRDHQQTRLMVVLFNGDEDLTAYKLKFA